MVRGTTPTLAIEFPISEEYSAEDVTELDGKFVQDKRIILEKNLQDFTLDGQALTIRLTEEETLSFRHGVQAEFQARIVIGGEVQRTVILPIRVDPIL